MLPRERVLAALEFRPVDKVPVLLFPAAGGLFEHGQKLLDLCRRCGNDFGPVDSLRLPAPPLPEDFDADGRYHAFRTDEWGTRWEYRIFGVWGHPVTWPLADLARLATYSPPPPPPLTGPEFEAARQAAARHREHFFQLSWCTSLFEKLCSLRPFQEVLMDIQLDTPDINRAADLLLEHSQALVRYALAIGADGISIGDDFGTQLAPIFPPAVWRRFFKPRYQVLFEPLVRAGKRVVFHSCGQIEPLLEDLRDVGVNAIWPQLPLFELRDFSRRCRGLHLAVQLHPDRGELMQHGTPAQVRRYLHHLVETFDTLRGGSWIHLEIDPGFPFANVEALFETVMELREGAPAV